MRRKIFGFTPSEWGFIGRALTLLFLFAVLVYRTWLGDWPRATFLLVLTLWFWDLCPDPPLQVEDPYKPMATRVATSYCPKCARLKVTGADCICGYVT